MATPRVLDGTWLRLVGGCSGSGGRRDGSRGYALPGTGRCLLRGDWVLSSNVGIDAGLEVVVGERPFAQIEFWLWDSGTVGLEGWERDQRRVSDVGMTLVVVAPVGAKF